MLPPLHRECETGDETAFRVLFGQLASWSQIRRQQLKSQTMEHEVKKCWERWDFTCYLALGPRADR